MGPARRCWAVPGAVLRAGRESLRRCAPTTSTFTRSTATPDGADRETRRRCTTWSRPGRCAISGRLDVTWQFVQAQYVADLNGWTRFCHAGPVQPDHAEEEREMLPFCLDSGRRGAPGARWLEPADRDWNETTARSETDPVPPHALQPGWSTPIAKIVEAVQAIASERDCRAPQVALAWRCTSPRLPRRSRSHQARAPHRRGRRGRAGAVGRADPARGP